MTRDHRATGALRLAPIDDEPETRAERLAVEKARRARARGAVITNDELRRRIGVRPRGARPRA